MFGYVLFVKVLFTCCLICCVWNRWFGGRDGSAITFGCVCVVCLIMYVEWCVLLVLFRRCLFDFDV